MAEACGPVPTAPPVRPTGAPPRAPSPTQVAVLPREHQTPPGLWAGAPRGSSCLLPDELKEPLAAGPSWEGAHGMLMKLILHVKCSLFHRAEIRPQGAEGREEVAPGPGDLPSLPSPLVLTTRVLGTTGRPEGGLGWMERCCSSLVSRKGFGLQRFHLKVRTIP